MKYSQIVRSALLIEIEHAGEKLTYDNSRDDKIELIYFEYVYSSSATDAINILLD